MINVNREKLSTTLDIIKRDKNFTFEELIKKNILPIKDLVSVMRELVHFNAIEEKSEGIFSVDDKNLIKFRAKHDAFLRAIHPKEIKEIATSLTISQGEFLVILSRAKSFDRAVLKQELKENASRFIDIITKYELAVEIDGLFYITIAEETAEKIKKTISNRPEKKDTVYGKDIASTKDRLKEILSRREQASAKGPKFEIMTLSNEDDKALIAKGTREMTPAEIFRKSAEEYPSTAKLFFESAEDFEKYYIDGVELDYYRSDFNIVLGDGETFPFLWEESIQKQIDDVDEVREYLQKHNTLFFKVKIII